MSLVTAQPELMSTLTDDAQTVGSALVAQNARVQGPTTGVVPAAADAVSILTATQFAIHAAMYQAAASAAADVHTMIVSTLRTSTASYVVTEAGNAAILH
jgi:hypothetical protein